METGLHAITNYAPPENKHAPLNRLLRQLKIPRRSLKFRQQQTSEILFLGKAALLFSNNDTFMECEMNKLKLLLSLFFATSLGVGLVACTEEGDKNETKSGDHVWKHQTDTLKTSKDVAKQLQDSLNQQQKTMDENN